MDQKRLITAIAASILIVLVFQFFVPHPPAPPHQAQQSSESVPAASAPAASTTAAAPSGVPADLAAATAAVPREVPRLKIDGARLSGSISLLGARLDDVVLRGYHQSVDPKSPEERILEPRSEAQPYYVQFGWSAAPDAKVRLPDSNTLWSGSGEVAPGKTATLSWDNGEGLTFSLQIGVDANYMFTIHQAVKNDSGAAVTLYPWSRIRRDYTPETLGYYILHEGPLGVFGGTLKEQTYKSVKSDGEKKGGVAYQAHSTGGWLGITDKYWLIALVPDQKTPATGSFRHISEGGHDAYQVDYLADQPQTVAPGAEAETTLRAFAGAKEVHLLNRYETEGNIPLFSYAVDWGWFFFITKPIFYAIDFLYGLIGNFGVAIILFTVFIKLLFFPLANKSYSSMSKMKLLGPKMKELREQYKDDPAKMQQATMALYKAEKVNPASGCLPIFVQIPVFFSLYKVIFTTIEMRHAPFFGWIHDLSAVDPTNIFNLFGLLPFDPTEYSHFLHLGVWPLIMGFSMYFQQKLNPTPPDPMQAKIFQWMPVIFTFMLANFPAGLVIYWTTNNILTFAQQWVIMRHTHLDKPRMARS